MDKRRDRIWEPSEIQLNFNRVGRADASGAVSSTCIRQQ